MLPRSDKCNKTLVSVATSTSTYSPEFRAHCSRRRVVRMNVLVQRWNKLWTRDSMSSRKCANKKARRYAWSCVSASSESKAWYPQSRVLLLDWQMRIGSDSKNELQSY